MIYLKFIWNSLRRRKKRTAFLLLSMTLSLSFLITLVTFVSSYTKTMMQESKYMYGDFDAFYYASPEQPVSLAEKSGFEQVGHLYNIGRMFGDRAKNSSYSEMGAMDPVGEQLSCIRVLKGTMPKKKNEIAMTENALWLWKLDNNIRDIRVGDRIQLSFLTSDRLMDETPSNKEEFVLTGILSNLDSMQTMRTLPYPSVYVSAEYIARMHTNMWDTVLLKADNPANVTTYVAQLSSIQYSANEMKNNLEGNKLAEGYQAMCSNVWLIAALILLIATISICSSYMISAAERKKTAGLLAAIGMKTKQILLLNLLEIVFLLAVSSAFSIAIGFLVLTLFFGQVMQHIQNITFLLDYNPLLVLLVILWVLAVVMVCVYFLSKKMLTHLPIALIQNNDHRRYMKRHKSKKLTSSSLLKLNTRLFFVHSLPMWLTVLILAGSCVALTQTHMLADGFTNQYKPWEIADYQLSTVNVKGSGPYDYLNMPSGKPLSFTVDDYNHLKDLPQARLSMGRNYIPSMEVCIKQEQLNQKNQSFLPPNDLRSLLEADIKQWGDEKRLAEYDDRLRSCELDPEHDYLFPLSWNGFDDGTLLWLQQFLTEGEIDLQQLNSGTHALIVDIGFTDETIPQQAESPFQVGDTISMMDFYPLTDEDGLDGHELGPVKRVDYPMKIDGRLLIDDPTVFFERDIVKPQSSSLIITGLEAFVNNGFPLIDFQFSSFLKEGADWQAYEDALREIAEKDFFVITSRKSEKERVEALRLITRICGIALTLMIALLGFFTFAAAFFSRIQRRRSQFAIMCAVGMTPARLRHLLLAEALCYGLLSAIIGCILSLLFYGIFHSQASSFPWIWLCSYSAVMVAGSMILSLRPASSFRRSTIIQDIRFSE